MANNTTQFTTEAQHAAHSALGVFQGAMETQARLLKQLSAVQQEMIRQAVEASNDQLHLIQHMRDPREYASAQADLARDHGQRYVNSVRKAFDIAVGGWQEYADHLGNTLNTATDQARSAHRRAA